MKRWRCGVRDSIWRVAALALLALVWFPASSTAQAVGPDALVGGFVRAWNSHDMKALGDLFTDDADFVNVVGMWWKGRDEIQARHAESHTTSFKTTTLVATGTAVRFPAADVGVIHFTWELTGEVDRDGKSAGPRRGIMQIVAARREDGWRIVAAQNTNALPPR